MKTTLTMMSLLCVLVSAGCASEPDTQQADPFTLEDKFPEEHSNDKEDTPVVPEIDPKPPTIEPAEKYAWAEGYERVIFHHKEDFLLYPEENKLVVNIDSPFSLSWDPRSHKPGPFQDIASHGKRASLENQAQIYMGIGHPFVDGPDLHMFECRPRHGEGPNYYSYQVGFLNVRCSLASSYWFLMNFDEEYFTEEKLALLEEIKSRRTSGILPCWYCDEGLYSVDIFLYMTSPDQGFRSQQYIYDEKALTTEHYLLRVGNE